MIVHAPNVHQSGGKVLLVELMRVAAQENTVSTFIVDQRLEVPEELLSRLQLVRVAPRILARIAAEFRLRRVVQQHLAENQPQAVLCFGNLPPLLDLGRKRGGNHAKGSRQKVHLFFQNVILLKKFSGFPFALKTRLQQKVERLWLRWGLKNVDRVWVQSESVRELFLAEHCGHSSCELEVGVAPFVGLSGSIAEASNRVNLGSNLGGPLGGSADSARFGDVNKKFDFVYVATGDPHKNHENLLAAWQILVKHKAYPRLALTLPLSARSLLGKVEILKAEGLALENFPQLSHSEVLCLYGQSRALVFPSYCESFGLPLLEARAQGLAIVAAERDYVRDLVIPEESFDPDSPKSIARAVLRFLRLPESRVRVLSAQEFWNKLQGIHE